MIKLRLLRLNTLYGKLLISFICIILLFSLFDGLLFRLFQSRLQKDTIAFDGMAYDSVIAYDTAASELRQWFWWSAAAFACTLVLAAAVALYFIRRIHQQRDELQRKMKRQRSLLTSYGYMSRIKNINEDLDEWEAWMPEEAAGSYDLILYELRFRNEALVRLNIRPEQAALTIREHIQAAASGCCPGSHTFQLEQQQILTVVRDGHSATVAALLDEVKRLLDQNASQCLVTVAVSSRFEHASQFGYAYNQVLDLARQALPIEETQIISSPRELPETPRLTEQEKERVASSLQAGQAEAAVRTIDELLARMQEFGASVRQYADVAEQLAELLTGELRHLDGVLDPHVRWTLRSIRRDLSACHTIAEFRLQLARLAETVAVTLSMRQVTGEDPVISRVMRMLEEDFGGDISLDQAADELNMSPAYLSTYIKEKTGTNFIDHLNGLRMAKAKELLTATSRQISDIAREVGYQNVTSFNRLFKKTTGVAPTEYRRIRQEAAASKTG